MIQFTTDFDRLLSKVTFEPMSGCWLWTGKVAANGYGQFWLQGRTVSAHRAAWQLHCADPGVLHVLHCCDNRACVNPAHLFLGSHQQNMADMSAKGRAAGLKRRGVAHPLAKLTPAIALEIRRLSADGQPQREIARHFGIGQATVSGVVSGQRWSTTC